MNALPLTRWAVLAAGGFLALASCAQAAPAENKAEKSRDSAVTQAALPRNRAPAQVDSIKIEGLHAFSERRLLNLMQTKKSGWFKKSEYRPDWFEQDLTRLTDYCKRRGYLQAVVDDKEALQDRATRKVRLTVWLYEGPVSRVKDLRWEGVSALSAQKIRGRLALKPGDPLDLDKLEASLQGLLRAYAEAGYLEAEVRSQFLFDSDQVDAEVVFRVKEGPLCRLQAITVEGLGRTRDWVVTREFRIKRGRPLDWSKVELAQRRLYMTNLFQSLMVRPVTIGGAPPGDRRLLVEVQEAQAREINLSGGWGTEDRFHGQVELVHNNMLGRARKVSTLASASRKVQHLEANYSTYWIAGKPWFNNLNGFGELQSQPGYDLRRVGGSFVVGHNLSLVSRFQVSYRHENAYLAHVRLNPAPDVSGTFVRSFIVSLTLDKRDNFANPRKGLYLVSSAEMSGSFLHGTDTFFKNRHQARFYQPLGPGTVLACALEVGHVANYRSPKAVPLSELFFAGGANALRGFEYRTAGPLDTQGLPLGGQFLLALNVAELRQRVWKGLGVVGFFDAGNVFPTLGQSKTKDLRTTGGWGLRLETRLGILRADQGFIVNPRPGEKKQKIYVSIGQAF